MKRRFTILTAAFMLLAFLAIPMGMMGQTRTNYEFNLNELYQDGTLVTAKTVITESGGTLTFTNQNEDFTILMTRNSGNQPGFYTSSGYIRFYNSDTFKLSAAEGITMTQITVTPNGTSFSVAAMEGLNTSTKTWTGSASEVTFTGSGTNKWDKLTITYSSGGSQTTTYTVTYNANVAGTDPVVDTYAEGANVTLRAANTFTNEGYTFSEWNTQADGDGDAYEAGDVIENIQANIELYAIWTENPVSDEQWVLTNLADLTANDVFVIVGNNGSNYAMSNDNGTDPAPSAVAVTVTGNEITSTVAANIQWNISGNATNGYTFYPNGSTTTWLYCTNTNNGVRVGTNTNKTFVVDHDYLKHTFTSRYVGIYNSQDWRCYTSYTATNIAGQTFAFYKKVTGEVLPPSITAANVDIEYNATSGSITYTINNSVEGGALTATTESNWLTLGEVGTTVPFTCTANEATTARTATVTLTYTYNRETVTKDVTVTQAAAPVIYTTIPDLFAAATSTETSVLVTFNNWVVSGVSSNGKNVFVTDNNGNGFVIYYSTDMSSTFAAGNILSGTAVSCSLKKYNGFAELLNMTATDLTITSGGNVTIADVALADLAGVNTGAVVSYENLTCSVNNNKYYLTDGTTTLQVYNALYAFDELEADKTYNITGVYQQYNNTKEILPRSADDIELVISTEPSITVDPDMVELDAEEHDGTLALAYENLEISDMTDFDIQYYDAEGEEATTPDWLEVLVAEQDPAEGEGYVVSYYMMENEGEARMAYFKVYAMDDETNLVYSNLVTVSQAAPVAPPTGDNYELFTGNLVEGDYLIVYDDGAMNNTVTSDRLQYETVTITNDVITTDNAAIIWHIAPSGDYWTIYNANANAFAASTGAKNKAQMLADGTDDKAMWTVSGTETYEFVNKQNTSNGVNANLRKNGTYGFACYATTTGGALSLYKKVEPETYTLTIEGYGTSEKGGYYLIASPVTVDPENVEGMTEGNYDLYYFDENEEDEWRNYKIENGHFDLEPGKGYLYAHKTGGEFTLTGIAYSGDGVFPLSYSDNENATMKGWNLVGNPFAETAYIDRDYYTMNSDGSQIIAATGNEDGINRMEGVFVKATTAEETVTFSTTAPETKSTTLALNLSQGRGVIDRAIVRFGEGRQLPKFQIMRNSTKLYIPQDNEEFAVVNSTAQGEMPVSFKAAENGRYTLSINNESVEMNYLHLIDNMTGTDIDLLQTPSYSFDANTTDYAQRFKLVFATGNADDYFAFFSNGNLVINNEGQATLQVVDITGRMISNTTISGCESIDLHNMNAGVYMIRLINGNDVKVQKVVVR